MFLIAEHDESPDNAAAIQSRIIKKKKKNKSIAKDIELHSPNSRNKSLSESSPTSDRTMPSHGMYDVMRGTSSVLYHCATIVHVNFGVSAYPLHQARCVETTKEAFEGKVWIYESHQLLTLIHGYFR